HDQARRRGHDQARRRGQDQARRGHHQAGRRDTQVGRGQGGGGEVGDGCRRRSSPPTQVPGGRAWRRAPRREVLTLLRRRLDVELVRRGLASSRDRAREDIAAGRVTVSGVPADKPARLVAPTDPLELVGPPPRFVGRGGEKLDAALERFDVVVAGRRALDAGASTGGFTDCLLQRGAGEVVAVDVGYGQLDLGLRQDPRVRVMERTNVRNLTPEDLAGGPVPLIVADLSFISLRTVAPALLGLAAEGADLVLLVKPQFEAGRAEASKGQGVIRDPDVWSRVLEQVVQTYVQGGADLRGLMASPLLGAEGNAEFLAHLVVGAAVPHAPGAPADRSAAIATAVAEATARTVPTA
ncbi:MAG: rRNA (cytidine1920-2-O)/16S rRNA (cytidine1409-2-O)-methyltransferase, partial [Actinomycetota bacterium]|nr:rRNA (cytidine1920-2-O)/16S rRNA (cytidine1409-2-O)-methyltransferase [Actinomycetota bacterium]